MGLAQHLRFKSPSGVKTPAEKKADILLQDFIPYAAFLDSHTVITKNGELLQTLRIATNKHGLPTEDVSETNVYLRDAIRKTLKAALKGAEFSVWMHITRDKTPLPPLTKPTEPFAAALQESWLAKQHTRFVYQNVCYLTILIDSESVKLMNLHNLKKTGFTNRNRIHQEAHIAEAHHKLNEARQEIHKQLSVDFGIEPLTLTARRNEGGEEVYYSEQLEFLHRIINLSEQPIPIQRVDVSSQLATHEMIFGFDALETKLGKHKRFASIVSIKHYHELPSETFDKFIQMPAEMLLTQTFNFVPAKQAIAETADIKNVLKRSKDGHIAHASGFIEMLEANQQNPTDFAEQQTTIMVMTDQYQDLDRVTTELQTIIAALGLVSVREDIKFEEVFWSQLPGNFEFIRRKHIIATTRICGMARLNYYLVGALKSRWGEPITIFPTTTKTPYLFHFHQQQSGHTVLIDYNSFPDPLSYRLTHFLCAAASKQTSRIILFDRHESGKMFTGAMHGHYLHLGGSAHDLALNPLAMESTPQNQGFLAAWMASLLNVEPDNAQARASLKACVAQGWEMSQDSSGFATLVQMMQQIDPALAGSLQQHLNQPVFKKIFSGEKDALVLNAPFTAINLHKECFSDSVHIAAFALMLHRIILSLDGSPTLIVIKEAWDILEHPFFASRLSSLAEMLTEQNAVLLITTRDVDRLANSSITQDVFNLATTKIFMPDDIESDNLPDVTGLSKAEDKILLNMERQKGEFIIKHGAETIPTRLKIDDPKLQAILIGDAKTLHGMRTG